MAVGNKKLWEDEVKTLGSFTISVTDFIKKLFSITHTNTHKVKEKNKEFRIIPNY